MARSKNQNKIPVDLSKYSFNFVNNEGSAWFFKASELLHAGLKLREISILGREQINSIATKDTIFPNNPEGQAIADFNIHNQATMIIGFSIENALKGILASKSEYAESNKLRSELKNKHDLEQLTNRIGIELSAEEKTFLRYFTESITWSGRYPIPINHSEYHKQFTTNKLFLIENNDLTELPKELDCILKKINKLISSCTSKYNLG